MLNFDNVTRTFTMKTALDKDATQTVTTVTVDFTGVTLDTLVGLAIRMMKVDWAVKWRKDGFIPTMWKYAVKDHGTGGQVHLSNEQIAGLNLQRAMVDPAYRAKMLADLNAMNAPAPKEPAKK